MTLWLTVIIFAILQGITEFLPISSSGHLALLEDYLSLNNQVLWFVVLHVGTLVSILLFYSHDILSVLRERRWRTIFLVGIGTSPLLIPAFFQSSIESLFNHSITVSIGFFITSIFLIWIHKPNCDSERSIEQLIWYEALLVGLVQSLAIIPGVSRSGSSISMGTRLGLHSEAAARFSFFLAIPAITGALILKFKELYLESIESSWWLLFSGFVISASIGLVSLRVLVGVLNQGHFYYFAYYCAGLAVIVLLVEFMHSIGITLFFFF